MKLLETLCAVAIVALLSSMALPATLRAYRSSVDRIVLIWAFQQVRFDAACEGILIEPMGNQFKP